MQPGSNEVAAPHAGACLLTGGSGMIGQALAGALEAGGQVVVQAVRGSRPGGNPRRSIPWDPQAATAFADPAALEGLDAVVHLSGANVAAHRWTEAYKREILTSRTESTLALARTLATLRPPPAVLLSASATGFYGDRGNEVLNEASMPGGDFLAQTCRAWEAATAVAEAAGIRVIHLRLGVVLSARGGALGKVLPLFRAGLGGRLGSGRQWMSWIAIDDAVGAIVHLLGLGPAGAGSPRGAVNCVAPYPVTNAEYTGALAQVLHRPAVLPAPAFALRLALGEMADVAVLSSCRALPEALVQSGFCFRFPRIGPALEHLLG